MDDIRPSRNSTAAGFHFRHRSLVLFLSAMLLLICSSLIGQSAEKPADITITVSRNSLPDTIIYFGAWKEKLVNPKCVNFDTILKNTPEFKELERKHINDNTKPARYLIYMSQASDRAHSQINAYARKNKIDFICEQLDLFVALKQTPEFKDKSAKELMQIFDITEQVNRFKRDDD